MGTYVTSSGLIIKTLAELVVYYETKLKEIFGNDIDTDPSGPFGQLVSFLAKNQSDAWLGLQEVYTSRDPNQATGTALDGICAETGVTRIDAQPTIVDSVVMYGNESTGIPSGSQIRKTNSSLLFSLNTETVISEANSNDNFLAIGTAPSTSETFTVTLEAVAYTHVTNGSTPETAEDVIDALVVLINAGAFGTAGGVAIKDTTHTDEMTLRVYRDGTSFNITYTTNFDNIKFGTISTYTCDVDGVNPVAEATLDTIVTPISGWSSVSNLSAGVTGSVVETDTSLRIRRLLALGQGKATEEAIRAYVLNNVENVISVAIASNRTNSTDGYGRPAKSFEVVVEGGTDADIAQAIWESMPAGVESFGTEDYTITDSQGTSQKIYFSRTTSRYIWAKVTRAFYAEEDYPADGDAQIKQAILDWSLTEFSLGKNVIRQRLSIPVYSVPGIGDITITLDSSLDSGHTPSYTAADVSVDVTELAVFALTRISVVSP